MRPAKTQISLGIRPVWSETLAVRLKKGRILTYPLSTQRRLWSDWADAQADLSFRWAHMPFCWFCHDAAQLLFFNIFITTCCCNGATMELPSWIVFVTSHRSSQQIIILHQQAAIAVRTEQNFTEVFMRTLKTNTFANIWAATRQNQQCGCAPSEDSDQPGHPPSLIRVFAVRLKKAGSLATH